MASEVASDAFDSKLVIDKKRLISAVQAFPVLYDKANVYYRARNYTDFAWNAVTEHFDRQYGELFLHTYQALILELIEMILDVLEAASACIEVWFGVYFDKKIT